MIKEDKVKAEIEAYIKKMEHVESDLQVFQCRAILDSGLLQKYTWIYRNNYPCITLELEDSEELSKALLENFSYNNKSIRCSVSKDLVLYACRPSVRIFPDKKQDEAWICWFSKNKIKVSFKETAEELEKGIERLLNEKGSFERIVAFYNGTA